MKILITRHKGAIDWARQQQIEFDQYLTHLDDVGSLSANDVVYGILPVHQAGLVCSKGIDYFHLCMNVPEEWRGQELTAEQMQICQARFVRYWVQPYQNTES